VRKRARKTELLLARGIVAGNPRGRPDPGGNVISLFFARALSRRSGILLQRMKFPASRCRHVARRARGSRVIGGADQQYDESEYTTSATKAKERMLEFENQPVSVVLNKRSIRTVKRFSNSEHITSGQVKEKISN
jgi:hypothetical protein